MSTLGDVIVEHGPYSQDLLFGAGFSSDLRWLRAVDLNELRDELVRLRGRQQLTSGCDCGHEGLDAMFHLRPCPVAELRAAARSLGYLLALIPREDA